MSAPTVLPLVCTVLPTWNERANIGALVDGLLESALPLQTRYRQMVLVVDDNSPDGTSDVLLARMARWNGDGQVRVALDRRVGARGLTSAIQKGIDLAVHTFGADIVTWMDCDLSMPPQDLPRLVAAVLAGTDVAVGSRWRPGGADIAHGLMARTLSRMINTWARLLLGWGVTDYTSGFVAGRAAVFRTLRLRGDYGEYCIDLLGRAQRAGFSVVEAPYLCVPRTAGESKTGASLLDYLAKGRKYVSAAARVRLGQ
ncbi:MAG: glycosyltransferase [Caldilineaceae bacterium]